MMQSFLQKSRTLLTPSSSYRDLALSSDGFTKAQSPTELFPVTDPAVDGEDCLHDCATCTVHYPNKFSIDEEDELYGFVKGWDTHMVVATGKTDWVRDVTEEKGTVMEAVGKVGFEFENGTLMLSASNMPIGECEGEEDGKTRCLLLPKWEMVDNVRPADVKELLENCVGKGNSFTTPLGARKEIMVQQSEAQKNLSVEPQSNGSEKAEGQATPQREEELPDMSGLQTNGSQGNGTVGSSTPTAELTPLPSKFITTPCPHRAIILMCSHRTRDARCGQSAPLLRKEFERQLRPLGLYRDLHDERPGGVGIYFINHVGGHKYSANVMIYRRQGRKRDGSDDEVGESPLNKEAVQGIWLARVRPEDCEGIVKYTVLQGKLVKPQRQLRGGFDRELGMTSW